MTIPENSAGERSGNDGSKTQQHEPVKSQSEIDINGKEVAGNQLKLSRILSASNANSMSATKLRQGGQSKWAGGMRHQN